jgi:hypothetical protein
MATSIYLLDDVVTAISLRVGFADVCRVGQPPSVGCVEYLREENRVLKERLGGRRIRFTDVERRRLARKAHALGRKVLNEIETLITPDTLLRWYRELVASKWNYIHRHGPGRPRVMKTIADLVVRWRLRIRPGATRESRAHWPIWDIRSVVGLLPTF